MLFLFLTFSLFLNVFCAHFIRFVRFVGLVNCWLAGDQVEMWWAAKQTARRADESLNCKLFG